jgi:eukaryotic-like serine/threonine-protein kinase
MALGAGTRLGAYEILAPLGAGGMGEVYRAKDIRLEREVALKILPQAVSQDSARRSRFEQEAKATSALNHPNIVSIYDIGLEDGIFYIVSELVDGESLRTVIKRGPGLCWGRLAICRRNRPARSRRISGPTSSAWGRSSTK